MSNSVVEAAGSQATAGGKRFTFAQIPLVMRMDPVLTLADLAVTMFVLPWMKGEEQGWVSLKTIAAGARLGVSTVRDSLKRLEECGWLAAVPSRANKTRRKFVALWLTDDGFDRLCGRLAGLGVNVDTSNSPTLVFVVTRVVNPEDAIVPFACWPAVSNEEEPCKRSIPLKPVAIGDRVVLDRASCSPESERRPQSPLGETTFTRGGAGEAFDDDPDLCRLRRAVPTLVNWKDEGRPAEKRLIRGVVRRNAGIAARLLFDEHSVRFHCKRLWEVARGELSPELYLQAIEITLRDVAPKDVENLGAYFKRTLDNLRLRRTDAEYDEEWLSQHGLATA